MFARVGEISKVTTVMVSDPQVQETSPESFYRVNQARVTQSGLECHPVKVEAAGSNPVMSAPVIKGEYKCVFVVGVRVQDVLSVVVLVVHLNNM
jgi:hypothetical protein